MSEQTFVIEFNDVELADANRFAEELGEALLDASPDVRVDRERADETTLDFGATLVLVLGTPAAIAIANALGNWLIKRNSASIKIVTNSGELVADNLTSKDAASLARLFKDHLD